MKEEQLLISYFTNRITFEHLVKELSKVNPNHPALSAAKKVQQGKSKSISN